MFEIISAEAILGALATLLIGGIPLYYRYVWGSKSRVSVTRLSTLQDSEWRDAREDSIPLWNRRCIVKLVNKGWRDGIITDIKLVGVRLEIPSGKKWIRDTEESVYKIRVEDFSKSGKMTKIDLRHRTNYAGQIIEGREDELIAIVPKIKQDSRLGKGMKEADFGVFSFDITIEDHERSYVTSIDLHLPLEDSSGGGLRRED
jgi:hypothetical protein